MAIMPGTGYMLLDLGLSMQSWLDQHGVGIFVVGTPIRSGWSFPSYLSYFVILHGVAQNSKIKRENPGSGVSL